MLNDQELTDVQAAVKKAEGRKTRPGICVCGHSMKKHMEVEPNALNPVSCLVLKGMCGCPEAKEAIRVPNARFFMYGTTVEMGHALARGILRTVQEYGRDAIEFVLPVRCMVFIQDERAEDDEARCGSDDDVRMTRQQLDRRLR